MDFNMNAKLDGLYYRTSATPSLCGPYKTVTTYNGCNAAKAQATQAYSRNDFERSAAENAKMISAADQSLYKQLLQYPKSLLEIIGSGDVKVQRTYVKNLIKKFPNLEQVLKPVYPKLFKTDEEIKKEEEAVKEGYYYSKKTPPPQKPTQKPTTTPPTAILPSSSTYFEVSTDINSPLLQGSLGNTNEGYSRPACSSCRRS